MDTLTGLSLSPCGKSLLSNAMDNTVRVWDVQPFVVEAENSSREKKVLLGVQHNFEKNLLRCAWSPDGKLVTAGSADRAVCVWDAESGEIVHRLGGHTGSVNQTQILGKPGET